MTTGASHQNRSETTVAPPREVLRRELARGDGVAASVGPVLHHLLTHDEHGLFAEDVIAVVRGMLADLAGQLCEEMARAAGLREPVLPDDPAIEALAASLAEQPRLVGHLHALALEGRVSARLAERLGLDPVLSPLVQAMVASEDGQTAADAMALLASEARFTRALARMKLPLGELPGELLHAALLVMRAEAVQLAPEGEARLACDAVLDRAETAIRARYDEGKSRIGLLSRLVGMSGGGVLAGLALGHAGAALFASALSLATGMPRDVVLLAMQAGQQVRLAVALRAAGVKMASIRETLLALHGDAVLPEALERLGVQEAAALVAGEG